MNKSTRETKARQLAGEIIDELFCGDGGVQATKIVLVEHGVRIGEKDRKPALLAVKKIVYQALREMP